MENPCKKCLLVNNCTAICEAKTNFKTLLNNAIKQNIGFNVRTSKHLALHRQWVELRTENNMDMANIIGRATRLKSGADNI